MNSIMEKLKKLEEILKGYGSAVLAYSGGVDSSFLLFVMKRVLKDKMVAVTAVSPILPPFDLKRAKEIAEFTGAKHIIIPSRELDNENFRNNPPDRCFYCKIELFSICENIRKEYGFNVLCDGSNVDDLRDYRPGRKAEETFGVKTPLIEAGFSKNEIRLASKELGLPYWNAPASPCLASRFPYGFQITEERISKVIKAEEFLKSYGFKNVRARIYNEMVKIEVDEEDIERLVSPEMRRKTVEYMKSLGFLYVLLDMEGYIQGSLNKVIKNERI